MGWLSTTTKRRLHNNNGTELCTGTTRLGGKLKFNKNKNNCKTLKNIINENRRNYNRYNRPLKVYYSELLRREIPKNLKEYENTKSKLKLSNEFVYYIEVVGKNIYIVPEQTRKFTERAAIYLKERRTMAKNMVIEKHKPLKNVKSAATATATAAGALISPF